MTLKALLLGSAAAMIAVSGARAADAVVAEPEAVEYVKVCDTYGAGFFYIPGTETCLRISGYARVDYSYDARDTAAVVAVPFALDPATGLIVGTAAAAATSSTASWGYRARVNFDARNETDYGTLRSQIRFQGTGNASGDAAVGVDRALISLGGFRIGYSDSFWTTNGGYGTLGPINDGYYGFDQAIFADYTFAANGFSATVGLEDTTGTQANDPALYAGVSYSGSWGNVAATVAYDTVVNEAAYIVKATVNVIDGLSLKAFYAGDNGGNTSYVQATGDYAWGVGLRYAATSDLALYASYNDNADANADYIVLGATYAVTPGFSAQAEVNVYDDDNVYRLRFVRSF